MLLPFEIVREQLLRAGIAPRHVNRYITELREHLADLAERERSSGMDSTQAADRALTLMGTEAELAQAMLAKGPPRSLVARAPWAVFALSPVLLLAAVIGVIVFSMFHLLWAMQGMTPAEMPGTYRALIEVMGVLANYVIGPLLAAGCITFALRQRLDSRWLWVGLALIAIVNGIFGFHMHVFPSEGSYRGGTVYSLVGIVYLHGHRDFAATLGVALLRAAVLLVMAATVYRALRARLMIVPS